MKPNVCPFCGSPAEAIHLRGGHVPTLGSAVVYHPEVWFVRCGADTGCQFNGPERNSQAAAVKAWNSVEIRA